MTLAGRDCGSGRKGGNRPELHKVRTNRIGCIGAGYVGGPTMAMIAYKCPNLEVYVCDKSARRIQEWNSDALPIYEPGLKGIVEKCRNVNLFFTSEIEQVIRNCDIIFVSVNTPTKTFGSWKGEAPDLSMLEESCRTISKCAERSKIIVEKSTVPVKTSELLLEILYSCKTDQKDADFAVISNPEFLAEGTAITDLEFPDRVLIGGNHDSEFSRLGMEVLRDIYLCWVPPERILLINVWSAELAKLAANAFLAQRISSINSISRLCEKTGAEVAQISQAIGTDSRIGKHFLKASVGFGGSCFKKDVLCLAYLFEHFGLKQEAEYWRSVVSLNEAQKTSFSAKIIRSMFNSVKEKKIAILGFSFKKDTGDVRDTPTGTVCMELLKEGARLVVFDPKSKKSEIAMELSKYHPLLASSAPSGQTLSDTSLHPLQVEIVPDLNSAIRNSHALVFCTDWDQFAEIDFQQALESMESPAYVFDGRNFLPHASLFRLGFNVFPIGSPPLVHSRSSSARQRPSAGGCERTAP
ncbi:UDP-glucose 6-dehydrogenase [Cryptosporidium felis]|nr:UDP-glucose 6-dehydrogenase [Cryptosporidium felis]